MSYELPSQPVLDDATRRRLREDAERYANEPLPPTFTDEIRDGYGINLGSFYGGYPIQNPFGKASGQLSLQTSQVETDTHAQLGFIVLKTVIAQDASGEQSMKAWAIPETRMLVEAIRASGDRAGWTVTWKGRGWYLTFEDYLTFFRDALRIGKSGNTLIVPSCKYHLPEPGIHTWRTEEYAYTTSRLVEVWQSVMGETPMPLEKDFSPTLAGDDRSRVQEQILEWLRHVPGLIREGGGKNERGEWRVRVGLKLMNAMFDDDFQLEMLRVASQGADWITYANRLFDPNRVFDGKRGVAYGGPDLSARNLRILRRAREAVRFGDMPPLPPISATGDILTGRTAVEYGLCGAENFQMHTLFQLPHTEFAAARGSRTSRALHRLLFDPENGYLAWVAHLRTIHCP